MMTVKGVRQISAYSREERGTQIHGANMELGNGVRSWKQGR